LIAVFGYTADEFSTLRLSDIVRPDERTKSQVLLDERDGGNFTERRFRRRMIAKYGRALHMDCLSSLLPLSGYWLDVLSDYRGVSEQVESEN
jgi:hypothetical protein